MEFCLFKRKKKYIKFSSCGSVSFIGAIFDTSKENMMLVTYTSMSAYVTDNGCAFVWECFACDY